MSLVVDASVIVKVAFPEPHDDATRRIIARESLVAPDLIWAELGSAVWKRARRGFITQVEARRAIADLREISIESVPVEPMIESAVAAALLHGRSVYDSIYFVLAERLGLQLVTADQRFYEALAPFEARVRWIADF